MQKLLSPFYVFLWKFRFFVSLLERNDYGILWVLQNNFQGFDRSYNETFQILQ